MGTGAEASMTASRSPDYILRVLVADVAAHERFQATKRLVMPGISRTISHRTLTLIERDL
jgi:hypothetical protein